MSEEGTSNPTSAYWEKLELENPDGIRCQGKLRNKDSACALGSGDESSGSIHNHAHVHV
jgi:hypothetical protein